MNKEQQIEEMAVIGCVRNPQAKTAEECGKCDFRQGMCNAYRHAESLYEAGYRKTFTSDLASDTQKAFKEGYIKGNIDGMLLARKETAKEILLSLRRFLIEKFDYFGTLAKRNEKVNSDNRLFDLGEQDMANCTLDRVNELLEKYGVEVGE